MFVIRKRAARIICLTLLSLIMALVVYSRMPQGEAAPASSERGVPVPIIMYHSVTEKGAGVSNYIISPKQFREDMEYLKNRGYNTVFVSELVDYVLNGAPLPEKPVIITLDDGHLNCLTHVLPVLDELDMKAVVSVVGAYAEKYSRIDDRNPEYAYLSYDDIAELAASGRVEIGNHTYSMHRTDTRKGCMKLYGESDEKYRLLLTEDVLRLQAVLFEKLGEVPIVFAFPFGYISEEALPVLKEIGFSAVLTCTEKVNYITGNPEQLFNLCRFNRASTMSTAAFMKHIGVG